MNAKVRDIMKTDVYTVTDEANIGEVIRILVDNDYSEKEYELSKEQEKQSPRHTRQ